jgi:mRNA interferase MazF
LSAYVPARGDVAWLNLDPRTGHEESGRRPALVLSPRSYNAKTGLAVVCPLTTKTKGYAFEVLADVDGRTSAILADHVKSVDWRARRAERIATLAPPVVDRVASIVAALIGADDHA